MKRLQGFTLIELLIVIVIIGVIMTYAIPSYERYVVRSNRVDGHNILIELAGLQEKHFIVYNQYATSHLGVAGVNNLGLAVGSKYDATADYQFTIRAANGYTFTATAIGSRQIKDTFGGLDCTILSLNSLGSKLPVDCWE